MPNESVDVNVKSVKVPYTFPRTGAHIWELVYKLERTQTINIQKFLHFHILYCTIPWTLLKELTHSSITLHNKHDHIFVERLAYFVSHNGTLSKKKNKKHTYLHCASHNHITSLQTYFHHHPHTRQHLSYASHIQISHMHTCGHTYILHTQTFKNAFDH